MLINEGASKTKAVMKQKQNKICDLTMPFLQLSPWGGRYTSIFPFPSLFPLPQYFGCAKCQNITKPLESQALEDFCGGSPSSLPSWSLEVVLCPFPAKPGMHDPHSLLRLGWEPLPFLPCYPKDTSSLTWLFHTRTR